ncbi:MAG TPA: hypothetical protein VKE51_02995 [Vicinamibacterales bacterium]|nr:hypothetical protein [Vicinamibacterales bacterium]
MRLPALVFVAVAAAATPLVAQPPSPPAKPGAAQAAPKTAAPQPQQPPAPAAKQGAASATPVPAATSGESKPSAPAATPQAPAAPAPPAPEAYSYRADGRRDPFQSLTANGALAAATSHKGEGPAGLAVNDISVRGVMQSRGAHVAMIMGPDNKTYIVHQGDKLLDGTIRTITAQGLVVVQEVNDPLSLVKQREVRKLLRSLEDVKE